MKSFFKVLLGVCLFGCFVSHSNAADMAPARAASSLAPAVLTQVYPSSSGQFALVATVAASTVYYGAPYRDNYAYHQDGTSPSVQAAIDKWWAQYKIDWAYAFPGCSYTQSLDPAGVHTGHFASFQLHGTCGGGGSIYGTKLAYDPTKNTGDGGGCNGGEGEGGGGGASGSGGEAGSQEPTCAQTKGAPTVGDPINASTGNKYLQDDDYASGAWLTFRRFYNSQPEVASAALGMQWRHSFDRSLDVRAGSNGTATARMFRPDGKQELFSKASGAWTTEPDVPDLMIENHDTQGGTSSYTVYIAALRHFETYSTDGLLRSVTDNAGIGIQLQYSTALTDPAIAPRPGLLLVVLDPHGRQLSFAYDSQARLRSMVEPDGGVFLYEHDPSGNLIAVHYPDGKVRQYVYNEAALTGGANLPHAMTGIVDEAGIRYEDTTFDSAGRATGTSFAGAAGVTRITYNSNGTSTVHYPLGSSATMSFSIKQGLIKAASLDQPCGAQCNQPWKSRTYDANGYPASYTDFNGHTDTTRYDIAGLLTQRVEGVGTDTQRTTTTTWDDALRLPLLMETTDAQGVVVARTGWVYNAHGKPLARCVIDADRAPGYQCAASGTTSGGVRRWTYTYCDAVDATQCPLSGLLLSVTGPRTDLDQTTRYSYYMDVATAADCGVPSAGCHQPGDVRQVTDALGHVTTMASYDGAGRVTRWIDANGVATEQTYTPRGWLGSRSIDGAITGVGYTPYGAVSSVTDPDGVVSRFGYDAAHRLTDVIDAQGNRIHYTLDASGNKTQEQVLTAAGTVVRSMSRTYNALGEVTTVLDGLNQNVFNAIYADSYDGDGNLVHSVDGRGIQQRLSYDSLNRLASAIADYNGTDPGTANAQTVAHHDALDRIDGVSDPDGLNTLYTYDGLGNRVSLDSPDAGTSSDSYDAAGNRLSHIDALGIVSGATYDALDRRVSTRYADTTLDVSYSYDEPNAVTGCISSAPVGHLTRIVESSVTTVFCYDNHGNVIEKRQVTATQTDVTQYAYTAANRLRSQGTPDHTVVTYNRDSNGRISGVQVMTNGATTAPPVVVSAISYLPFGPISSYTLGNGQTVQRTYDANERLTDLASPALSLHFARDVMGNIAALGDGPGANPTTETYSYDPLYRLTGVSDAGNPLESYTYNRTGDRMSKSAPGLATGDYTYGPGTHQLIGIGNAARVNDANGNTIASVIGGETFGFAYNGRNRMSEVQRNGAVVGTYTYNALGQRIGKVATLPQSLTARYAYDEAGHLIAEYDTSAAMQGHGKQGKGHDKKPKQHPKKPKRNHHTQSVSASRDYIWVGDLPVAVIDNTISGSVTTSTVNYVTADQLGTPRAITDSTGIVIWQWAYAGNPFGEQQPTSATEYVLNLRYPGQYYDAESGLVNNGYRSQEAAIGRFLQSDPSGLRGGISLYVYGLNNPLRYVDPTGLAAGDKYTTIDRAGVAAVTDVLVVSVTQNREYAGVIYGNWDGTYSYTEANPGTEAYSYPGDAPWFHDKVGIYHTHGQAAPNKDTENFSHPNPDGIGDTGLSDELGIPNYLGTARFAIKKYDPCTKTVTILQPGV